MLRRCASGAVDQFAVAAATGGGRFGRCHCHRPATAKLRMDAGLHRALPGHRAIVWPDRAGLPGWLRWQHLFNIVSGDVHHRAGLQILADHPRLYLNAGSTPGTAWLRLRGPVPADRVNPADARKIWTAKDDSLTLPHWLGIPGIRHLIGLARWWHFSFDLLWLVNGIVFYVLLFVTGQWRRIVPQSWDVLPNAASTAVQYASLDFPANEGFIA